MNRKLLVVSILLNCGLFVGLGAAFAHEGERLVAERGVLVDGTVVEISAEMPLNYDSPYPMIHHLASIFINKVR